MTTTMTYVGRERRAAKLAALQMVQHWIIHQPHEEIMRRLDQKINQLEREVEEYDKEREAKLQPDGLDAT